MDTPRRNTLTTWLTTWPAPLIVTIGLGAGRHSPARVWPWARPGCSAATSRPD